MIPDRFNRLLKATMGLDYQSVGASAISRAVEQRARLCAIDDPDIYWDRIVQDRKELQALVEAVVVPETWFYRDREAFAAMVSILQGAWPGRAAGVPFRLLSLPCSTGEEPYTMALALLDAGLPLAAFRIQGIDISHGALQRARAAVYGRNSFRGSDLTYRDRHFTEESGGFRIADAVRAAVAFTQGNIFELPQLEAGSFDVIFCRNLLIYFDAADQRRAISVLRRLLAPQGILFVGHSETWVAVEEGFAPLRIPYAFAFRKEAPASAVPRPAAALCPAPKKTVVARKIERPAAKAPAQRTKADTPPLPHPLPPRPSSPAIDLAEIRRAADRGDLQTAARLGAQMVSTGRATAEALHLLAVISDSAGDIPTAADYYRKVLYLEPEHHEALTHLALLLDKAGDGVGARRMRDRARRIGARKDG
ncbi:MAG: CheR family methyltransferase [Sphingobium sp.]